MKFKVGDRIVIVNVPTRDDAKFGDYENGDEGIVCEVFERSCDVTFNCGNRGYYSVAKYEMEHSLIYNSPLLKALL